MRRTPWLGPALAATVVVAVVVAALVVPWPTALELRDWARSVGPLAPLVFVVAHALATTTPVVPRTAFTLSAGLIFGPWWGLLLALTGSTASAVLGFLIARRLGHRVVARLGAGRVRRLEARLSRRGLLTVTSTRLVPAIPFAPLNYTLGVTSVAPGAFLVGTVVGLAPGTAAVVLLGDAATGNTSPAMFVIFAVSGAIGLVGVVLSARADRRDRPARRRVQ